MKNKIRIRTNTGDIVFDHSRAELCEIDPTREAIFLWDDGDFTRGFTNGIIEGEHIRIYSASDQDEVYYAMEASRLIAWSYRWL